MFPIDFVCNYRRQEASRVLILCDLKEACQQVKADLVQFDILILILKF